MMVNQLECRLSYFVCLVTGLLLPCNVEALSCLAIYTQSSEVGSVS